MARDTKTKRRRKKARRARNKLWETYRHAWFKATAGPFRRRQLVGLGIGRNITLSFDLDHETPIPLDAVDPSRPDESLEDVHRATKAAEETTTGRGEA